MLHFDKFETLTKDAQLFPKFSPDIAALAREQALRTIVDALLVRGLEYPALFTNSRTFLTPRLAAVYGVPFASSVPNGSADPWQPHAFPPGDPRANLQMQLAFVALHSHPGRTSPTLRGKAVREILLCQRVPDPPGNVDFTVFEQASRGETAFKTARERLDAHAGEAMCKGCHKITDPIGLAMENFDTAGGYRRTEDGAVIDASGELDGKKYADAVGLGTVLQQHPAATSCAVNRLLAYAVGIPASKATLERFKGEFATAGYKWRDLLKRIALSDVLFTGPNPQQVATK
jgi:hypothetical protein